jgi:DNA repair protein RadB
MVKISAGSYDLNKWLHGGYECNIITVLYGAAGTGKTNFCILAAVSQAKKRNKVLFIDTEGGFSSDRVKQMAGEQTGEILKNILLLNPLDFSEQKEVFRKLSHYLKDEISLIIVDGMTMLYRLEMATAREQEDKVQAVNSELASQMRTLAEIARKRGIPIIVTNQVYRWDEEQKMVGGDILKYWGKCLIELTNEKGRRSAALRKHRSLPESVLDFQIVHEGVKKKGWL